MVSAEELNKLFEYRDGKLYWKFVEGRRKETNNRYAGKEAGCVRSDGYRAVSYKNNGQKYVHLTHRIIYAMHYNCWPELLDHIDRNVENNSIENLRPADKRVNSINRNKPKNNTSGIRGVSWNKVCQRWEAYIKNNQKRTYLGLFHCFGQAIKARKDAEKHYWSDV